MLRIACCGDEKVEWLIGGMIQIWRRPRPAHSLIRPIGNSAIVETVCGDEVIAWAKMQLAPQVPIREGKLDFALCPGSSEPGENGLFSLTGSRLRAMPSRWRVEDM